MLANLRKHHAAVQLLAEKMGNCLIVRFSCLLCFLKLKLYFHPQENRMWYSHPVASGLERTL